MCKREGLDYTPDNNAASMIERFAVAVNASMITGNRHMHEILQNNCVTLQAKIWTTLSVCIVGALQRSSYQMAIPRFEKNSIHLLCSRIFNWPKQSECVGSTIYFSFLSPCVCLPLGFHSNRGKRGPPLA